MKRSMWARLTFAVVLAILGVVLPPSAPRAQLLTPDSVSPDVINQILGDFFQRQAGPPGAPVARESPVDASRRQAGGGATQNQAGTSASGTLGSVPEPSPPPPPPVELSPLEKDYAARLGEPIKLFGYDLFEQTVLPPQLVTGAIPETYVLGVGDELVINLVGTPSRVYNIRVDLEGRAIIPDIGPVTAAGRRFQEFRSDLEVQVAQRLIDTQVFVSIGQVRSIAVAVLGEVTIPGVHRLTGLSSVLDALFSAGGVKRTGSLRRLQVLRGSDIHWVDLYDLMLGTAPSLDITLQDGDRILVPTIGATVAVAGKVRRPAIYELAEGQSTAAREEVLEFAGGPLRRAGSRMVTLTLDETGREQVIELPAGESGAIRDGDIVLVSFGGDVQVGSVFVEGHARVTGRRSLTSVPTVRALIPDIQALGEFPYLLFAVLRTHDPYTNAPVFVPVDLQRVLSGVQDIPLKSEDRLIVLSLEDVRYLWTSDVQSILAGRDLAAAIFATNGSTDGSGAVAAGEVSAEGVAAPPVGGVASDGAAGAVAGAVDLGALGSRPMCPGLLTLFTVVTTSGAERFSNAALTDAENLEPVAAPAVNCPKIFVSYPDLLPFVLENVAVLKGEVRIPGVYPVAVQSPLNNLLAYAGGITREADLSQVEILRQSPSADGTATLTQRDVVDLTKGGIENVFVSPGETIAFSAQYRDRDTRPILLVGEFVRPGLYQIRRGERLSEVVTRAGGLTPQAYPYGAVFTRERTKQIEKVGFERAARELEIALATALSQRSLGLNAAAGASALQNLADQFRAAEPVGRVVIEADPTVLQVRPELDTVLEGGDKLFMPKRPNSVTVIGDVLNEGTLQFLPGARVDEYIDKAGGFRRSADEGRVFVILPNGEAQPVSVSAWNYTPVAIPPGSTVVIPKEAAPLDIFAFIKDLTQITSQLAVSAAAIAAINRN